MIFVALAELALIALLLVLRNREQAAAAQERRSLLDRIQHPERQQVAPGEMVEHEAPEDAGELALLGTMDDSLPSDEGKP